MSMDRLKFTRIQCSGVDLAALMDMEQRDTYDEAFHAWVIDDIR